MTGGAGIRETWGRAAPGTGTQRGSLPSPLGRRKQNAAPETQLLSAGGGADTPTEKPLTLPPPFLAETSGLWTPTGYSGAFLIYFITHFTYM